MVNHGSFFQHADHAQVPLGHARGQFRHADLGGQQGRTEDAQNMPRSKPVRDAGGDRRRRMRGGPLLSREQRIPPEAPRCWRVRRRA